jgi:hypothetical protein
LEFGVDLLNLGRGYSDKPHQMQNLFAQSRKGKQVSCTCCIWFDCFLRTNQYLPAVDVLCDFAALRETPWFLT